MHQLSEKLTNLLINQKVIASQEKEVYLYSIELLLSTIINGLLVILMSVILKEPLQGLIFAVVFIIMRQLVGGYHARSHLKCILSFSLIFFSFLMFIKFLPESGGMFIIIGIFLIVIPINFILAPVEHPNKPLSIDEKSKLGMKVKIMTLVFMSLAFVVGSLNGVSISSALFVTSLLCIGGLVKKKDRKII